MRWTLGILLSAMVFYGCKDDEEDIISIVLVEAPSRLPFIHGYWDRQPYDTTAVKFVVRLEPNFADVDSILCVVRDDQGSKIDSFLLFDDGSQIIHSALSPCETPRTGDNERGDGNYTRLIHAHEFTPNYGGALIEFQFSATAEDRRIAGTTHQAPTWAPTIEVQYITTSPDSLPLCVDTMYVTASIRIDESDSIESVGVGFSDGSWHNYIGRGLAEFSPISGDTVWQGFFHRNNPTWREFWGHENLVFQVGTALVGLRVWNASQGIRIGSPTASLDLIPDSIRLSAFGTTDTLILRSFLTYCPGSFSGPIGCSYSVHDVDLRLNITGDGVMNDCQEWPDYEIYDDTHSGAIFLSSNSLSDTVNFSLVILTFAVTYGEESCWEPEGPHLGSREFWKTVTVLPPQ